MDTRKTQVTSLLYNFINKFKNLKFVVVAISHTFQLALLDLNQTLL